MSELPAIQTATHCRVSITLRPVADSEIKSEVWLPPASVWNGKLLMEGGGGLVGSINTEGMTNAVREGYASASTDTGHTGSSGRFALGHPDKIRGHEFDAHFLGTAWNWLLKLKIAGFWNGRVSKVIKNL